MPDTGDVVVQTMPTDEEIVTVLREPQGFSHAVEVFTQLRVGREQELPSAIGLNIEAQTQMRERASHWLEKLKAYGCLETFIYGMRARNLLLQPSPLPVAEASGNLGSFDDKQLRDFMSRQEAFRCVIQVAGETKGSGILVGPNSVLTAWHVIATGRPEVEPEELPEIHVVLADGRRIGVVKLAVSSPCADVEWPPDGGRVPSNDHEALDRHDIALLHLYKPAGIHLGYAALASSPSYFADQAGTVLVSYPAGAWSGVEFARMQRLQQLTARWCSTVTDNRPGSSGGGYFDNSFSLVGIHQGRWQDFGRLVPLIRFYDQIRQAINDDEVPPLLWSLDGSPDSNLIVARDKFFIGYQAAMRGPARARGLWVCRLDPGNDVAGLPFSYQILARLVARSPNTRLMRVSFDTIVHDLPQEIMRRAGEVDLPVAVLQDMAGAGLDQTEPEARIADRARRIALSLNEQAYVQGVRLWVFFDHPAAAFGDELRWALSAFVEQALKLDNLRIALAGFELVQMPCARFNDPGDAFGSGPPGLMVEYLGDLEEEDVRRFIRTATDDLKRPVSPERVDEWTEEALEDLAHVNGRYDSRVRSTVAERLQKRLQKLCKKKVTV
jgi:V8-like Glu-specific endopeptidase